VMPSDDHEGGDPVAKALVDLKNLIKTKLVKRWTCSERQHFDMI